MNIYKVKPIKENAIQLFEFSFETEVQISVALLDFPIKQAYFNNEYGFDLNQYEINHYNAHLTILNYFLEHSNEEWCLVFENGVQLYPESIDFSKTLNELPLGTELFFPYDKLQNLSQIEAPKLCAGKLAHFWGSYIYFINRSGAKKMLSKGFIDRPFDETMLELSFADKISTVYAETGWFQFNEKLSTSYLERYRSIKDAIMNHQAWSLEQKESAKKLLHHLVKHAEKLGIKLMLHAGTLLGQVRHGGIMPWDDDIDISILNSDLEHFLISIKEENLVNYTTWVYKKTNAVYYKFWLNGGEAVDGYEYTFPFIDFWIVYNKGEEVHMTDGYIFNREAYLDLKPVDFEGCKLFIQRCPEMILDVMYNNWNNEIQVFSWSHRTKELMFKALTLEIGVDDQGRMLV